MNQMPRISRGNDVHHTNRERRQNSWDGINGKGLNMNQLVNLRSEVTK
jgi:hypothetical protein